MLPSADNGAPAALAPIIEVRAVGVNHIARAPPSD